MVPAKSSTVLCNRGCMSPRTADGNHGGMCGRKLSVGRNRESVSVWVCEGSKHFISFPLWYFKTNLNIMKNVCLTGCRATYPGVVY